MRTLLRQIFVQSTVTLVGFLLVSFPVSAQSLQQQSGGNLGARFGGSFQSSVTLTGLGPILLDCIAKEVGVDLLNSANINPFNNQATPFNNQATPFGDDPAIPSISNAISQPVPVTNVPLEKDTEKIKQESEDIKKEQEKATRKERCEDKIARFIALQAMDRITFSTLEWINSGFEGKPFYLEDPAQFFTDFATKELLGFSASFSGDAELYPFGTLLARTVLSSFQRSFEQNMINSLNAVLAHGNYNEWTADFSVGGWAGYTAFIEPNNNIFGAYIESTRNIQRNLQGARISEVVDLQRQLEQGLGFLSQRECAQTESYGEYIPENDPRHLRVGVPHITSINQIPTNVYNYITDCDNGDCEAYDEDIIAQAELYRGRSICTRWHITTPGNQIAQQVTKAIGISQDQVLLADELNENIGLIFDALLNQFITKGLQSFSGTTESNVAWAQLNNLNPGAQLTNNVDFNQVINGYSGSDQEFIGIIPTQETYLELVQELISLRQVALQRIYDLDYCVPGPNPLWQNASSEAVSEYLASVPSYTNSTIANTSYVEIINTILDISVDPDNVSPIISDYTTFFGIIANEIFQGYADVVNERFGFQNQDLNGNVRQQAFEYFLSTEAVIQSIIDLEQSAQETQLVIDDLIELREEYAQMEYQAILQELQTLVGNNVQNLADNLATFQGFSPSQITYIGQGGQNSTYHNAVIALSNEIGSFITPPQNDPAYTALLDDFADILDAGVATDVSIQNIQGQIQETQSAIGNAFSPDSLIGLITSCVTQVNSQYQGYPERVPYPVAISQDLGLPSLSTTNSFIQNMIAAFDPSPRNFSIVPEGVDQESGVQYTNDLQSLEAFMNSGNSLY